MKLSDAAPRMNVEPSYLRRLAADSRRPLAAREYPASLHEHYRTATFVKDTKGRRNVSRGRFEWHVPDHVVARFERDREARLSGRDARRNDALEKELAALGVAS